MASIAPHKECDKSKRRRWLPRVRGQWLTAGIAVGLLVLVSIAIWRMWSVDELPDIGDPFDVAERFDRSTSRTIRTLTPSTRLPIPVRSCCRPTGRTLRP